MAEGQLIFARLPIPKYNGHVVDRGEIFKLTGARNDEKLIGLKYVLPFDPKVHRAIQCDKCGRKFVAEGFYTDHKRKADCNDKSTPTRQETAELIGVDPEKLVMDKD